MCYNTLSLFSPFHRYQQIHRNHTKSTDTHKPLPKPLSSQNATDVSTNIKPPSVLCSVFLLLLVKRFLKSQPLMDGTYKNTAAKASHLLRVGCRAKLKFIILGNALMFVHGACSKFGFVSFMSSNPAVSVVHQQDFNSTASAPDHYSTDSSFSMAAPFAFMSG